MAGIVFAAANIYSDFSKTFKEKPETLKAKREAVNGEKIIKRDHQRS
ncbi:hypothetical protein CCACVL1_12690 [Corchorus capsularis]|uniref:Uncharacterized protein n=1 Tax=Corchorus capsularis TaxID=210143 RepID=A0A1R3IEK2_COCAP|nr:hypothetical protein CCACVL1_12690 [Corchorus capsularis]